MSPAMCSSTRWALDWPTVHVLAPYPGWESFLEHVEEAIAALPDTVRGQGLATLAVRYIDRITLPRDVRSVADPEVIYDLSLQRSGAPLCGLDDGSWRPIVEALHERQREVFEASITDRMRELFQ